MEEKKTRKRQPDRRPISPNRATRTKCNSKYRSKNQEHDRMAGRSTKRKRSAKRKKKKRRHSASKRRRNNTNRIRSKKNN